MYASTLVTPPAVEPVTLAEAKAHMRVDATDDDALISSLIVAARQWAERFTNRAFITQTWKLALDPMPVEDIFQNFGAARAISLPRAPLQSVETVQYYADDDTATVWPSANYFVDTMREPGRLVLRSNAVWPSPTRRANALIATYTAGYGDDATSVPEPIRAAILELVAHWYERRGDETAPSSNFAAQALLAPYRLRLTGIES